MNKIAVSWLAVCILLGGCASSNNYTSRKKFTGIDYSAYERTNSHLGEDFTGALPQPSILGEGNLDMTVNQEPQEPSEDEDFTSEEIAASYGKYTDVTVVAAAKRIKLGSSASTKHMALFQQALGDAYKKALRTYRPSGFTYSISSVGAVNPLSDVEVSCILGEQAASDVGQPTCNLFFKTLTEQYNTLLQEAKANAAL